MHFAAMWAPVGQPTMFADPKRFGDQFGLLDNTRIGLSRKEQIATAVWAAVQRVREKVVDHLRWKFGPLVSRVSRLSATLPFLAALATWLLRLDDVARRRFRRSGRVLASSGQLLFELLVFVTQPRILLLQLSSELARLLAVRTFARFPHFHDAGQYCQPSHRARSIAGWPFNDRPASLGRGRLRVKSIRSPFGRFQVGSLTTQTASTRIPIVPFSGQYTRNGSETVNGHPFSFSSINRSNSRAAS